MTRRAGASLGAAPQPAPAVRLVPPPPPAAPPSLTPRPPLCPRTVVITATSVSNTSISASTPAITITPAPAITVTLSTTPTSLFVNGTTPITATVANDSANGGVTWSCAPAGTCGSFSSATTASGVAVTYTAPATVPASTVVITATSVTNTLISASTPAITINPASGITVTLSTVPTTLAPSATQAITATASDAAGVNWTCTPGNSASTCGSFSSATTLSGVAVTYTAPATAGLVTVTATSVTDSSQSASATVTITTAAAGTLPAGNYVFSLTGTDANTSFYSVSGVFTLGSDGATITGGEQDFVDAFSELNDTSLTGSVAASGDGTGNLLITLSTGDVNLGPGGESGNGTGTETLVATLVSNSQAAIAEYDTWATSSGTLDLQDSAAAAATPSAGYAFFLAGFDTNGLPLAIGGVINVDGGTLSPGGISGTGSIFDVNDNGSSSLYKGETFANTSLVSAPDGSGRVTFTLNPNLDFSPISLVGYIVDATHIRLVETFDAFNGTTGGTTLGQGANTGTFSSSSFSGNSYVVALTGVSSAVGVFQGAGLFTAGSTAVSGNVNYNDLTGAPGTVQSPDPVTERVNYTVDSTGRVSIPGLNDGSANNITNFNLQLYLDGNGNALAISLDSYDVISGLGYQQTGGGSFTAGSFNGTYVLDASGADATGENAIDAVGPVIADGVGTFAGSVDLNWIFNTGPAADLPVSGAFTAAGSGVFTGTITGLDVLNNTNPDAFAYYLIDTTRAVAIETDPNQLTLGYFVLQH